MFLFHGWNGSNSNLRAWLPALEPRFTVIAPDLPGCASVPTLTERHTAQAYARWAVDRLDEMGIARTAVGGLCSGSSIALALAALAPDRVTALLLHTPFIRPDLIRPAVRWQLRALASPLGLLWAPLRRNSALAMLHRRVFANGAAVAAENIARDQLDLERADPRAGRELAMDLLAHDHVPSLKAWRKPLYVLLASGDAFVDAGRTAALVRDTVAGASVLTFPGGHGWTSDFIARQHAALALVAADLGGRVR